MKTEIKFRVKYLGSICYYLPFDRNNQQDTFPIIYPEINSPNKWEYMGRFTGLKDMNGKEIYEGDIIQYVFEGKVKKSCVSFTDGRQLLPFYDSYAGDGLVYDYMKEIEVIGNIYENPKLLSNI